MRWVKTVLITAISGIALLPATEIPALNMSEFGAGNAIGKGSTYYVAPDGSNSNSGSSRDKAYKTLKHAFSKLKAGDTLYVAGGKYNENNLSLNNRDDSENYNAQSGRPDAPIRIIGLPGEEPVISGGKYYPAKTVRGQIAEFDLQELPYRNMVQEYPSRIELQRITMPELVEKYPGTFYLDEKNKKLLVHYAALEQTGIMSIQSRMGLRVCGSFIHLENLTFEGFSQALYLRRNRPNNKNTAGNITVKDCRFYYNTQQGLCIDSVEKTLVTGCRFAHNTYRGGLLILPQAHDNLIYGNWAGDTAVTLRQYNPYYVNYAFNQYGYTAGPRNHFIGNVMDCEFSFRWKDDSRESLFISNILTGVFCVQGPVKLKKQTMVNNVLMGKVNWVGIGYNAWDKDFANTPILFKDNVRSRKDFKPLYPIVLEAEKLAVKFPAIKFPRVVFDKLQITDIESTTAVVSWNTPDADGTGRVAYRKKGENKFKYINASAQGSEHIISLSGLQPDTDYECRAILLNRRGKPVNSRMQYFRTAKTSREPKVLEVGNGKLSLQAALCMVLPGDTIKLAPGRYKGSIALQRSGLPGKPITIQGNGAILDACRFYAPMMNISNQSNIIIDGIVFVNPESTARKGIITATGTSNIVIRNCRTGTDTELSWLAGGFLSARNSSNITVENNVIWGGDYPIEFSGKGLVLRHNTIVKSAMMSVIVTNSDNITLEKNIFYRQCVDQKVNQALFFNGKCTNIKSDHNVFFSPLKTHPIGGRFRNLSGKVLWESPTLEAWQKKTGFDLHSIHADPMFENVEKGDFRFKKNSPAVGRGAVIK
ncbi:MAG: hypothetical protein E7039_04695 [Lentisphaerae bacterium]|nr:hypothetical protein [Lentisphaerota bacterium]